MKLPTRLRILNYLNKQHTASTTELGHSLGMTRANIHHHLAVLETNEQVEVIGLRKAGKGRPENIYGISRRSLGDGLDRLSSALLSEWLGDVSEEITQVRLQSLATQLGMGFIETSSAPLPKRLTELISNLNLLHYQARWEAGASGARIVLGHCPFSAIIEKHPELCRMDAFLLEKKLSGYPIQLVAKMEIFGQGLPQCIFEVG